MDPIIDRDFAEYLLRAFDNPQQYGVHQLFNDWWRFAPDEVKAKYVADFETEPAHRAFAEEGYYGEPLDLATLGTLPDGSLGSAFRRFIIDNGLEKNIAINYRLFHTALESAGTLNGMPHVLKYAVLRGFQTHDLQHVVTGYDSSPRSEIALQAFCLAQIRFPYFAMWMSVVTTRMTFIDPNLIRPAMDAIAEGWQFGRRVPNIQFAKWEAMLDRPLDEVRRQNGIDPTGRLPLAA